MGRYVGIGGTAVLLASSPIERSSLIEPKCSPNGPETVRRRNELVDVSRFVDRVAGVRDDAQIGFGPGRVEVPRGLDRADHVVAAL